MTKTTNKLMVLFLLLVGFCKLSFAQSNVIQVPYSTGFESSEDLSDWNDEEGNMCWWETGADVSHTGSQSLYVTNSDGFEYYSIESITHFYARVNVPAEGMYIDFDYRVGGLLNEDQLLIGLLPPTQIPDAMYGSDRYDYLFTYCCTNGDWEHESIFISPTYAGEHILVFTWENGEENEDFYGEPAAIDNLALTSVGCPAPANLTMSDIDASHANIGWGEVTGATGYVVSYSAEPFTNWMTESATGNSHTLTALSANTTYQWKVAAICQSIDTSLYSNILSFTTTISCEAPHSITHSEITDSTVLLAWHGNGLAVAGYDVRYAGSDGVWHTITSTDTFCTLQGLFPGDSYQVGIRTICHSADTSSAAEYLFNTPCYSAVRALPFEENFENIQFPENCWSYMNLAGTTETMKWSRTTTNVFQGNGAALFDAYHLPSGDRAVLITPPIDNSSSLGKTISFAMYRNDDYWEGWEEGLRVWINTTPDTNQAIEIAHISRIYLFNPVEDESGWYSYSYELPTVASPSFFILFEGISEYGDNVIIDNIRIHENDTVIEEDYILVDLYETLCEGDSIFFQQNYISQAGTYQDTIQVVAAPDTIVTLYLTVNTVPQAPVISRENVENEIWLVADADMEISWYLNEVKIPGANAQRYAVETNGSYYATYANTCGESSPSDTILIIGLGISLISADDLTIYPNPAQHQFHIKSNGQPMDEVEIYTQQGVLIRKENLSDRQATLNISNLATGLYMIRIKIGDDYCVTKLIVTE